MRGTRSQALTCLRTALTMHYLLLTVVCLTMYLLPSVDTPVYGVSKTCMFNKGVYLDMTDLAISRTERGITTDSASLAKG